MQHLAVELLILADNWAEYTRETERWKALTGSGQAPGPDGYDDPADDAQTDLDYSQVEWADEASPEEWQQMQQALAASSRVTVQSSADPDPEEPALPDVDFDREWT